MVAAVHEGHLDVDEGVPHQGPVVHGLPHPALNGREVLPGYDPACNTVLEQKALAPLPGSISSHTWPYWPLPPVCRTKRPSMRMAVVMASR